MIVVRITMNALPEKQKEVVQTLLSMIGPMEKVQGCLSYSLLSDMKNHNLLSVLEEWEDRENLNHHFKSDIFGVLLGTKSLLCHPHGIHIYTVEQAEGMDAVRAVRSKRQDET
jgi:quinol monooxygenase YgiN